VNKKNTILVILLVAIVSSIGTVFAIGATNIIFKTSDGITSHEVMRITSDGEVGIGTATPQSTLDVNGDIISSGTITSPTIETLRCNNFNRHADLSGCNFSNRDLRHIDVEFANLTNANLQITNLQNAILTNANLSGADLSGANLNAANLNGANFQGANLTSITSVGCFGIAIGIPAQGTLPVCNLKV
jgi:hypothetical protein